MIHLPARKLKKFVIAIFANAILLCGISLNFNYIKRTLDYVKPDDKFAFLDSDNNIPNFAKIGCDSLSLMNASDEVIANAKQWNYTIRSEHHFFDDVRDQERCQAIKNWYGFNLTPLSKEEELYPLAYGILVHRWIDQVYYMMSAIYQPQNVYCIGIDNKSNPNFKQGIALLEHCFPNIHVMVVPNVYYCGFSVLNAVHLCLRYLTLLKHDWKYYQYLTGVDLPLKTNHQMVRIFKQLNGSFNGEVKLFQNHRIKAKKDAKIPYGIQLFKSSLSATFNRKTANYLAHSKKAKKLLKYLNGTFCPDESFWVSMVGNPNAIRAPASFDAAKYLKIQTLYRQPLNDPANATTLFAYISRFQNWVHSPSKCYGKYVSSSCVFGVQDVPGLLQRPHLVAHKFHLVYQPATFFCVYKKIRERFRQDINLFNDKVYGDLPGPRITRGDSVVEWFQKNYRVPKPRGTKTKQKT